MLIAFILSLGILSALFFSLCFRSDTPITGDKIRLGDTKYNSKRIDAPTATSYLLDSLSYLLTRTIFGRSIRRILLDQNEIVNLRELGCQITIPPLNFPMKRLTTSQYNEIKSKSSIDDANHFLLNGIPSLLLTNSSSDNNDNTHIPNQNQLIIDKENYPRTIHDYYNYYRSNSSHLPSIIIKRTLQVIKDWEKNDGFKIFSCIQEDLVLKQVCIINLIQYYINSTHYDILSNINKYKQYRLSYII